MHRRDFLLASSLLAASGAQAASHALTAQPPAAPTAPPPLPPPNPNRPKRTLKKAVMIGMLAEGSTILDKFRILRDCGFDGVECDSPSKIPIDETLAASEKTGLKVHGFVDSVHWNHVLNHPDAAIRAQGLAGLQTALRDGQRLGSLSVLLVPAVVDADKPIDDAWRLSQEEIIKALPLAKETGVKIAVENVWNNFIFSPLEAKLYVDQLNAPHDPAAPHSLAPLVGWHLDIGNLLSFGWAEQWVRVLGPRILKLHIKDFSRAKRDNEGLWKGFNVDLLEGDANWPAVMKALDDVGYSTAPAGNWATAEIRGGKRDRMAQIAKLMDTIFTL